MPKPKLHLDADASSKSLHKALLGQGYDVTRTPNQWMPRDATDERQLLGATAQGRCILTFNIRDFIVLGKQHPQYGRIIFAAQASWSLSSLIESLGKLLSETDAEDWPGRVQWLE